MAPSGPRDDQDDAEPVEADDEATQDEADDDDFDGFSVDDEDLPFDGSDAYADEAAEFVEDDPLPDPADDADEADDTVAPLLAADRDLAEVVAAVDEDGDDEDDAVREGEFICRSCFMAKRDSALADEDALLCRDCV